MITLPQAIAQAKLRLPNDDALAAYSVAFLYEFKPQHAQDVVISVEQEPNKTFFIAIADSAKTVEGALTSLFNPSPEYPREEINPTRCRYIRIVKWVEIYPTQMRIDAEFDIPCHQTPVPKEPHV